MKRKYLIDTIIAAAALAALLVWLLCFPPVGGDPVATDANTFTGVVTSVSDGGMLLTCDTDQFNEVWVSLTNCGEISPAVGERYEVTHTGEVLEIYPPQVTAVTVTLLGEITTTQPEQPDAEPTVPVGNTLSFTGTVLEIEGDSVLMDCHDKAVFDTVWVYLPALDAVPQVGETYTVLYEDMMMPSLPPRITAVRMEKN